jgi:hypothetical protein
LRAKAGRRAAAFPAGGGGGKASLPAGWQGGGTRGGEVLLSHAFEHLATADAHAARGGYAEADLAEVARPVAANGDDGDLDVVADEEALTWFASQDEH